MAALGTIRKRGVILVCIISFGLFAFIAEEGFRSCDSAKNNERQQIGEVLGEKISVQEFQKFSMSTPKSSKCSRDRKISLRLR